MLTSFFKNTKPFHLLLSILFCTAGFLKTVFTAGNQELTGKSVILFILYLAAIVLTVMTLEVTVKENRITKNNSYSIFFLGCFFMMMPFLFSGPDFILVSFFLLLALREILSLNREQSQKRILNASILITLASLFYFSSIWFFMPLWFAVTVKPNSDYKQMLIPVLGFFSVLVLYTAFKIVTGGSFSWILSWPQPIRLNFTAYNDPKIFIPLSILLVFFIWTGFFWIAKLNRLPLKRKPGHLLMIHLATAYVLTGITGPEKTGSEIIFLVLPAAVFFGNYMDDIDSEAVRKDRAEFLFKEVLLWMILICGFIFLLI